MQIVPYPHPSLRWKSSDVTRIDAELRSIVKSMFDLMYEAKGIGLAANQVALPLRLFVMNPTGDPAESDLELVFINPEITSRKGSALGEEGCLSLPDLYADVRRAEKIVVEAYDLEGQGFEISLDDLPARVVQHELDHVDGVLFIDRVSESAQRAMAPKLADFDAEFRREQSAGHIASDDQLRAELQAEAIRLTQEPQP
ncbi:MAG: peptide deformylase [Planctomycetaceae bacterium]|nr:peptide deformylase [Planctomycetaceae bacterium]